MQISIELDSPNVDEFMRLREKVGWQNPCTKVAKIALKNSLFHVVARNGQQLVGIARIVGDGAMFFYIQDVIVDPDFQGQGVGELLMQKIESYLKQHALNGATIGLFSAQGKEAFYARYGYQLRTGAPLGLGMCKFV